MLRDAGRRFLLLLGLLLALACACAEFGPVLATETSCSDGIDNDSDAAVDCDDPDCANDPACKEAPEICDDGLDNDGDGDIDEEDADCEKDPAPGDGADCTDQNSIAGAGGDADSTNQQDGCDTPTGSDSGEGDMANLEFYYDDDSGVVQTRVSLTANDADAAPNVTTDFTVRFDYEAGGSHLWVTLIGFQTGPVVWQASGTCQSEGYVLSVVAPWRVKVPTGIGAGSVVCDFHLYAALEGPGSGTVLLLAGVPQAKDTDQDGKSDRNDGCVDVAGDELGCPEAGEFAGVSFFCKNPDECHCEAFPTPCFLRDGAVETDDARVEVSGPNESIVVETDGDVRFTGGTAEGVDGNWTLDATGATGSLSNGVIECDGRAGGCDLSDGRHALGGCTPDGDCLLVANVAALDRGNPKVAQTRFETGDPAVDGQFTLRVQLDGGPPHDITRSTSEGVGTDISIFFFETATVEALAASGFETPSSDCPGLVTPEETFLATFNASRNCTIIYNGLDLGDVVEIGVDGGETFVEVPDLFGPDGIDRFGIAGAGGLGAYLPNFSLVSSLSEVGTPFGFRNLLFGVLIKAPEGADDSIFVGQTTGGALLTGWYPDLNGYGARQFVFGSYRNGQHRNGDVDSQEAIVVSNTGIQRLFFQDFGGGQVFLTSATHVPTTALPAGYTPWATFWTDDSGEALIAAQSTTAGANSRIFRAGPTTGFGAAVSVGEVDPGVRLMDCAQAQPPNWICVSSSFEGDANVIRWVPGVEAEIGQEIDAGLNPLGVLVEADGENVNFAIANYGGNSITIGTAAGDTGSVLTSETRPLPAGVVQPSDVTILPGVLAVLARDEADPQQTVVVRVPLPW